MKELLKDSAKLYLRNIVVAILTFFVVVSIFAIANAALAEEIGYTALVAKKGEENTDISYTHYLADGEDTKLAEYEKKGYTVSKVGIREMSKSDDTICIAVSMFFTLGILASFIYPILWDKGNKDLNMVRIGKRKEDKLKGLKTGAVAQVPALLFFVFLGLTKSGLTKGVTSLVYSLCNMPFYPVFKLLNDSAAATGKVVATNGDLSLWHLGVIFLSLFSMPLIAHLGYTLGYKDIAVLEKVTYKKTK